MIIGLKKNTNENHKQELLEYLEKLKMTVELLSFGDESTVVVFGETSLLDVHLLEAFFAVKTVQRIQEPYVNAVRKSEFENTIIDVGGVKIGGGNFTLIAGPCSVESESQIIEVAKSVKKSGANFLRGGAFKPRTSPYAFQGMGEDGIKLLLEAKKITSLPIVTEIMDINHIDMYENVDVIQVGARNMQNFELLKELGKIDKPILLKRGLSSTLEEFVMSAEYILAGGNRNVILCERGIRTFETATRNTLDISAVPLLKEMTHLPVMVDPSHATGIARLVRPLSLASVVAGADGVMVEVHNDPKNAKCDGQQSLTMDEFEKLSQDIKNILPFRFTKG